MGMYFLIAARNLVQARRRSLLLTAALGMVSMLLVLLLALSQGISDTMMRSATVLVAGHVNVAGFFKGKPEDAFPLVSEKTAVRESVEKLIGDKGRVIDRGRGFGKVISETSAMQVAMGGVDISEEPELLEKVMLAPQSDYKEGGSQQILGKPERLSEPNTILIFVSQAERLEVDVGDVLTITTETVTGKVNTEDVEIVAVAKDIGFMSKWNIFVPKQVLRNLYRYNDDCTGAIQIYLDDPDTSDQVLAEVSTGLAANGFKLMDYQPDPFWRKFEIVQGEDWTGQKLDLTTWQDEVSYVNWAISALDSLSLMLISILLVIIVIGIINTMFMSVKERTKEIGSLRAIGMHRHQILAMFITEGFLLGLVATTAGSLLGAVLSWIAELVQLPIPEGAMRSVLMSETLHLSVNPSQVIGGIIAMTLVTVAASLLPALRAARMQPITAIHQTG